MKDVQADRAVIVTGGSGALGRAVVARFLAAGDRVVVPWIVARERDAIEAVEGPAIAAGRLALVEADLAEAAGAEAVARALPDAEVLVNGVGGFAGGTPLHETELEVWDRMFLMKVRTTVAMCRRRANARAPPAHRRGGAPDAPPPPRAPRRAPLQPRHRRPAAGSRFGAASGKRR